MRLSTHFSSVFLEKTNKRNPCTLRTCGGLSQESKTKRNSIIGSQIERKAQMQEQVKTHNYVDCRALPSAMIVKLDIGRIFLGTSAKKET